MYANRFSLSFLTPTHALAINGEAFLARKYATITQDKKITIVPHSVINAFLSDYKIIKFNSINLYLII
jgi:hypothetical protein